MGKGGDQRRYHRLGTIFKPLGPIPNAVTKVSITGATESHHEPDALRQRVRFVVRLLTHRCRTGKSSTARAEVYDFVGSGYDGGIFVR